MTRYLRTISQFVCLVSNTAICREATSPNNNFEFPEFQIIKKLKKHLKIKMLPGWMRKKMIIKPLMVIRVGFRETNFLHKQN